MCKLFCLILSILLPSLTLAFESKEHCTLEDQLADDKYVRMCWSPQDGKAYAIGQWGKGNNFQVDLGYISDSSEFGMKFKTIALTPLRRGISYR